MRHFWDGTGELPDDAIRFTTDDGVLRGRPYVRHRVVSHLTRGGLHWLFTPEARARAVAETVDNDAWLAPQNGCLVSYLCRAVTDYLFAHYATDFVTDAAEYAHRRARRPRRTP